MGRVPNRMQDDSDFEPRDSRLAAHPGRAYRLAMENASPDQDDRLKDFFARHGGASTRPIRKGQSGGGVQGWSEVYANDGYTLRCDWSTFGSREEMKYSEVAPGP
jgi:hypothetical protein